MYELVVEVSQVTTRRLKTPLGSHEDRVCEAVDHRKFRGYLELRPLADRMRPRMVR